MASGLAPDLFLFPLTPVPPAIKNLNFPACSRKKWGQEQFCYAHNPRSGLVRRVSHCGLAHSKVREMEPEVPHMVTLPCVHLPYYNSCISTPISQSRKLIDDHPTAGLNPEVAQK